MFSMRTDERQLLPKANEELERDLLEGKTHGIPRGYNGIAFVQRQDALEVHTSLVSIIGILEVIESDSSKSMVGSNLKSCLLWSSILRS